MYVRGVPPCQRIGTGFRSHRIVTKHRPGTADYPNVRHFSLFRRDRRLRRLTEAVRNGVGVRECEWRFAGPLPPTSSITHEIVEWVRETMSAMRRPNGIDHVALALACRDRDGRVVHSNSLGVVRPSAFYGIEGIDRIEGFVADVRVANPGEGSTIIGALLSLGDVAYELSNRRAA